MGRKAFLLIFALLLGWGSGLAAQSSKPLKGHYFVLDPGHGDTTGARRHLAGSPPQWMVREHNLANVVLRMVKEGLEAKGATIVEPVRDTAFLGYTYYPYTTKPFWNKSTIFPSGKLVEYSAVDLQRRVDPAIALARKYGQTKVVYLGIHFENGADVCSGSFLVVPYTGASRFANKLLEVLKRDGLLRKRVNGSCPPYFLNGNDEQYGNTVRVLLRKQLVVNKVILEILNLNNDRDFAVITNPVELQKYAQRVVDAVVDAAVLWAQR